MPLKCLKKKKEKKKANSKSSRLKNYVHVKYMLFGARSFVVVKDIVRIDHSDLTHRYFRFADVDINLILCLSWLLKQRYF